jgi:hypothetical protein
MVLCWQAEDGQSHKGVARVTPWIDWHFCYDMEAVLLGPGLTQERQVNLQSCEVFIEGFWVLQLNNWSSGIDKEAWYREKFGAERVAMMQVRLAQIGKEAGIDFKFGGKTGRWSKVFVLILGLGSMLSMMLYKNLALDV